MSANETDIIGGSQAKRPKTNHAEGDTSARTLKKHDSDPNDEFEFSSDITLEDLRKHNEKFIKDRNWHQFHSPRNVLLALVGEVGELSEIFQWKGEVSEGLPEFSSKEREHVGQELSDVLVYLLDLAARCHVDLPAATLAKMEANARKYPVSKAYGKANKYTDYQEESNNEEGSQK